MDDAGVRLGIERRVTLGLECLGSMVRAVRIDRLRADFVAGCCGLCITIGS